MNIQQQINYHPVFRWNKTTHLEMTMMAAEGIGITPIEKRLLARYSQVPDFDVAQKGFFNNTHFYFPHSADNSFGKDKNGKNNAYSMFMANLSKAFAAKNREEILKYAGYALHFLQDMSMPLHTKSGGIISKILDYKTHVTFETDKKIGATANIDTLLHNCQDEKIPFTSFAKLFFDTACFSALPAFQVTAFNKLDWFNIQQACINKGLNVSKAFLHQVELMLLTPKKCFSKVNFKMHKFS